MDTQFLNTDTNKLVFGVQWKYSIIVDNKKNIKIFNTVCKSRPLEALI